MRTKEKVACGALTMVMLCGILGLVWLAMFGTRSIALPIGELAASFYILLGIMGLSMVILITALLGKK